MLVHMVKFDPTDITCVENKKIINISLALVWDDIAQPLAALALFTRATFL